MVTIAQPVVVPIITPDRAELIGPLEIKCSEPNCSSVFKSRSNLALHLQKVHKKDVSLSFKQENTRFYCPEDGCVYNHQRNLDENINNYFTELKALKQHYIKVHKAKDWLCKNCSKAFSDEFSLRRHEKCCGFKYYCAVCGATYRSQPCLGYHVKQKGHSFTWSDYDELAELYEVTNDSKRKGSGNKKEKKVLHQAIQTDVEKRAKKRRVSQTTQTAARSAKRKKLTSNTTAELNEAPSASTQTLPVDLSIIFDDPLLLTDSASQTLPSFVDNDPILCDCETQTERDVFLSGDMNNSSDSTDLMLFNHMQTQTNQELISGTEFSDIETQTHWDTEFDYSDFYVSTETQTHFPRTSLFFNNNNNPSSYTQTSQSIEFLNSLIEGGGESSMSTSTHTQT